MSHGKLRSEREFRLTFYGRLIVLCIASASGLAGLAKASTLCVNLKAKSSCYKTIAAAVAAATAGDTITVAAGTYAEDVVIGKPLSLVGQNSANTIIDAKGLSNGIYIDGFDAPNPPGLADVVVTGFTIENANFEGILVQNASAVTILSNVVKDNDQGLQVSNALCPGQPAFETNEATDCGEGIHLIGADHSIVSDNTSEDNSGGILVTDETAPGHDNLITRNTVVDNPYACGITIASHPGYVKTGTAPMAFGIYHNTVSDNEASRNGLGLPGAGAGIGLYAPGPGNVTIYNTVIHNRVMNNGLPGVAVHNHAYLTFPNHPPNPDVNDNAIIDNWISGNAADPAVPTNVATGISVLGVTPITGLVISGNTIVDESIDVALNSASAMEVHLNDFYGTGVGIDNLNAGGTVNATENWWGCAGGPGVDGCSTVVGGATVVDTPWLTKQLHDGW
jgi:parallel beta-helix repeat protein